MTDETELNDLLAASPAGEPPPGKNILGEQAEPPSSSERRDKREASDYRQWSVEANRCYRATGDTCAALPVGTYTIDRDSWGLFFQRVDVATDDLVTLPDTASEYVLRGMRKFWASRARYARHGLLHKRGVLLWGPPGSGKTVTVALLGRDVMAEGGVVVITGSPKAASDGLAILRRLEPDRPLVCVEEDIDELIARYGEHELLALLDGENQVGNVVHVATTNYPERLGARIINRPSRFDERIKIGMPSAGARALYIGSVAPSLSFDEATRWVADTEGLSIAHLRELAVAVLCLDQPYADVLGRLRSMRVQLRGEGEDLRAAPAGFDAAGASVHAASNGRSR